MAVFLREWIEHIKGFYGRNMELDKNSFNFIVNHLYEIQQLENLKYSVINSFVNIIKRDVENELDGELLCRQHSWQDGKVLRFSLLSWKSESDVVLYLTGESSDTPLDVRIYVCKLLDDNVRTNAEKYFEKEQYKESWYEGNQKILVLKDVINNENKSLEYLSKILIEKIKELNEFEEKRNVS